MTNIDHHDLTAWLGKQQEEEDVITARMADAFRATFDPHLWQGDGVWLGLHWCLFAPAEPMAALGRDGHPKTGGWLPPIPLPRRMWAGGRVEFLGDLQVGDRVRRETTIAGLDKKQGRTGPLYFLALDHVLSTSRGIAIRERQDIVYRDFDSGGASASNGVEAAVAEPVDVPWTIESSEPLLFRYSALMFNAHRIHYDLPYVTQVEGYPGLVVQGPLQATLILNRCARDRGQRPSVFAYRGVSPLIAGPDFTVEIDAAEGEGVTCVTRNSQRRICMKGQACW